MAFGAFLSVFLLWRRGKDGSGSKAIRMVWLASAAIKEGRGKQVRWLKR
jgi:hypothetical protein